MFKFKKILLLSCMSVCVVYASQEQESVDKKNRVMYKTVTGLQATLNDQYFANKVTQDQSTSNVWKGNDAYYFPTNKSHVLSVWIKYAPNYRANMLRCFREQTKDDKHKTKCVVHDGESVNALSKKLSKTTYAWMLDAFKKRQSEQS